MCAGLLHSPVDATIQSPKSPSMNSSSHRSTRAHSRRLTLPHATSRHQIRRSQNGCHEADATQQMVSRNDQASRNPLPIWLPIRAWPVWQPVLDLASAAVSCCHYTTPPHTYTGTCLPQP
mmetsp:Transcript_79284/g.157645  ORF Transcript_79284/g.157645 Transcript_79284/m.157645 type:complete len:120 (-) Transcript_79284:657-1016(-)